MRELGVLSENLLQLMSSAKLEIQKLLKALFYQVAHPLTKEKYPTIPKNYNQNIPILGICYGLQLLTKLYGGKVKSLKKESLEEPVYLKSVNPY